MGGVGVGAVVMEGECGAEHTGGVGVEAIVMEVECGVVVVGAGVGGIVRV